MSVKDTISDDLRDQAREWLTFLYAGQVSEADRARFRTWLHADPAHAAAYREAEQLWADIRQLDGLDGFDAREALEPAAMARRWPTSRRAVAGGAIAAALAVLVWGVVGYVWISERTYATGVGEIRQVVLDDGSTVTLSGASAVQVRLSRIGRQAELTRGQAYFEVAPDPDKAFTVAAGRAAIRVVGTAFDVRRAAGDVRVSVAEGVVEVAVADPDAPAAHGATRLTVGERVTASATGTLGAVERFDPAQAAAWREGRFTYTDARLSEVIADVNRFRADKIRLVGTAPGDLRVTATFTIEQVDQMLGGLAATQPVVIDRSVLGVTVRMRRDDEVPAR